jgi:hypothetical protein
MQQPSVGRIVHYVSYGTPGGEYTSQCRAAIIAAITACGPDEPGTHDADLVVFNPGGLFFNNCPQDEDDHRGGTWHWPERVDS